MRANQTHCCVGSGSVIALDPWLGRRLLGEILRNRRSLRDAFRAVSDEAAADDNFFPLMYAVYGLNTVQFTDPLSAEQGV